MALKVYLDPNYAGSRITLVDDNRSVHFTGQGSSFVRTNIGVSTGKWYWEGMRISGERICVGIVSEDATNKDTSSNFCSKDRCATFGLDTGSGVGWLSANETGNSMITITSDIAASNLTSTKYNSALSDIFSFGLDMDNKVLYIYKNNTILATIPNLPFKRFHPAIGSQYYASNVSTATINFGELASSTNPFAYSVPIGYKPYYLAATEQYNVTLDPNYKGSDIVLSDDKMTAELTAITKCQFVRATHGTRTGSWYWEYEKQDNGWSGPGIISIDGTDKDTCCVFQSNNDGGAYRILSGSGLQYLAWKWDNIGQPYGTVITTDDINPGKRTIVDIYSKGDTVGFHLNMNDKTLTVYRNGIFVYTQNNIPDKTFFPGLGVGTAFDTSALEKYCKGTFNFGESPFKYTIPNGAKPYYKVKDSIIEDLKIY